MTLTDELLREADLRDKGNVTDRQHGTVLLRRAAQRIQMMEETSNRRELRLKNLAANAILMAQHGDYSNGVTGPSGYIDEGVVRCGEALAELDEEAKELGVVIHGTFLDNDKAYGKGVE